MSHIKKTIFINASVEKFAGYARNPKDWPQWYIHLTGPDKLTGSGEAGTIAEFRYSMLGVHLPVIIKVMECDTSPGNILGRVADKLIVEKVQDNATMATLENLKAICEAL